MMLFISDIDECLTANGGCPQRCIKLPGSYECGCFDGYYMNEIRICQGLLVYSLWLQLVQKEKYLVS